MKSERKHIESPDKGIKICCRICGFVDIKFLGIKTGAVIKKDYYLFRCPLCGFAFVANPNTDFGNIYNADYYAGGGRS
jgi:hypothetical protein